jgi:dihydroflavonol-4-reductase
MGTSGEAYLLGGHWKSLKELFMLVSSTAGKNKKPFVIPTALAITGLPFVSLQSKITGKEPLYTREAIVAVTEGNHCILSDKARHELAYTTRPLEETIRDTCDWFLKNGYLD